MKVWPRKGSKSQKREKLRTERSAEKRFNNKERCRIYHNEFYRPRPTSIVHKIKNVEEQKMKNTKTKTKTKIKTNKQTNKNRKNNSPQPFESTPHEDDSER